MKLELAKRLVDAAKELDIEASLYENYSGRWMYGKSTTGIVLSKMTKLPQIVALAMREVDDGPFQEMLEELGNLQRDNMGYDVIVY